jgi:hypothetical protein
MKTNLAMLLIVSTFAQAELLSEHNEQHAAVQAAVDRLYDSGCERTQVTRTGRFRVNSTVSSDYLVSGVSLTVKCVKWQAKPSPTIYIHDLTWARPTTRADNSPLLASEISGYMLEIDGYATNIGNVLTYSATYSVAMPHVYRIATIDTLDQVGPWSEIMRL